MTTFPDNLGIIGVGNGKVVFPAPEVYSDWNDLTRSYSDNQFRWKLVTGLEPTPSLGYQFVEPASYRLEITPDLGWPNTEMMFEPYVHGSTSGGNPLLRIIRDLKVGTDLTLQSDGSVIYNVDIEMMRRILAPGFDRYLWRVMAVAPNSHTGHPSTIQSFHGRVVVVNIAWTLREPDSPSRSITATLSGVREPSITKIEINGDFGYTTFPSPDTWVAEVPLGEGRNTFLVRAFDTNNNGSEYRQAEVEVTSVELSTRAFFNKFDDFGYAMGLARLPGEKNPAYRERIKDVRVHRASTTYAGLMNGITRELGLTGQDQAILIKAAVNGQTQRRWQDVSVWLTARYFYVRRATALIQHERHVVEGRTWQVHTNRCPAGPLFTIESPAGTPVDPKEYRVDYDVDQPYVQFLDGKWSGRPIWISYQWVHKIPVEGKTVQQLVNELNSLKINDEIVVEAQVGIEMTGSETAMCLQKFPPVPLFEGTYLTAGRATVENAYPIRWVPFELNSFADFDFIERFKTEKGSLFGSQYAGWANGLKSQLKVTWGYLVADEASWSSPLLKISGPTALPLIYDAYVGSWISERGGYRLSPYAASIRGWIDPRDGSDLRYDGVKWSRFWSGKGYEHDLLMILDLEPNKISTSEEESVIIRQVVDSETVTFEDLGIGMNSVDSSSEVA